MFRLVQYKDYWNDEFAIQGFSVMNEYDYKDFIDTIDELRKYKNENGFFFYIGLNDEVYYHNVEDFMDTIEITDISNLQAETLTYFFGIEYGIFPLDGIKNWLHDKAIEREL